MENLFTPDVVVFLAGACYVLGYLIINQVGLRLMILLGTCFYTWYYSIAADEPLWAALYLSIMIGAANLIGLFGLYLRRSRLLIPRAFQDLYAHFGDLPPGDFRELMARCDRRRLTTREEVTKEGTAVERLIFVISGKIDVEKRGDRFPLPSGIFIGEVAFLTGRAASATTWIEAGAEILEWDVEDLRRHSRRKPRFQLALEAMISKDLAAKVAHAVAPMEKEYRPEMGVSREMSQT